MERLDRARLRDHATLYLQQGAGITQPHSYLQREDDDEDALLLVGEDVLDERPTGTDQHDREEQQGALKYKRN